MLPNHLAHGLFLFGPPKFLCVADPMIASTCIHNGDASIPTRTANGSRVKVNNRAQSEQIALILLFEEFHCCCCCTHSSAHFLQNSAAHSLDFQLLSEILLQTTDYLAQQLLWSIPIFWTIAHQFCSSWQHPRFQRWRQVSRSVQRNWYCKTTRGHTLLPLCRSPYLLFLRRGNSLRRYEPLPYSIVLG